MDAAGFAMYDIAGFVRPNGRDLAQIDILFVPTIHSAPGLLYVCSRAETPTPAEFIIEWACNMGLERHRVQAARLALFFGPFTALAQSENPTSGAGEVRAGGGLVLVRTAHPTTSGRLGRYSRAAG